MPLEQPLLVRNLKVQPLVFTDPQNPNHYVEFAGSGNPDGNDIQIVPGEMGNSVAFRRAKTLGLLKIEEDDANIEQAMAGQVAEWNAREQARTEGVESSMDMTPDNDMIMANCIGPSTRPGEALCGTPMPIRAAQQAEIPPLCPMHQNLAAHFKPHQTGRKVGNRDEVTWVRAQG